MNHGHGDGGGHEALETHVPIILLTGTNSPPEGAENADAYVWKAMGLTCC
jgi:hypothetical protein